MKNSKERLDALSKEFRRRLKEEKKSGISSKDFPSLTLAELCLVMLPLKTKNPPNVGLDVVKIS